MTAVKFCGLTRKADIDACNRLRPDYAGFVFWKGSKRFIDPDDAKKLMLALDTEIVPVGVFLDQPISEIIEAVDAGIRMIQLHGSED